MRKHNRLRVKLRKAQSSKSKRNNDKCFRKDPYGYAQKLFNGSQKAASPTFTKEDCEKHFRDTYHDEGRDHSYIPLTGMKRPEFPTHLFDLTKPKLGNLVKVVSKKRNGAAAGLNGLGYVPYKKCPSILKVQLLIFLKIWTTKEVPEDWARAYMVLLSKSDILDSVSEFRPIALTNCNGKIFFSVLSNRMESYFVQNSYIKRSVQKGFLSGVSGCLEHSFALWEALREAKESRRQIVSTWIDLANAYGSVRHNLIQFALWWYHVPDFVQSLIFDYYNKLCAKVTTKEWETGFFLFDIGLFQGCVLSTILFDAVFNLLLDFLSPRDDLGFVCAGVQALSKAYADDLTLTTRSPEDNQIALDTTVEWLDWTVTMKAKPSKCYHIAMKIFDRRTKQKDKQYVQYSPQLTYSAFDAKLFIKGIPVKFIVNLEQNDTFKQRHFKFLGRNIDVSVEETLVKAKLKTAIINDLAIVSKDHLNGYSKCWLYQHYIISKLAWPFLIHDFCRSFVTELQPTVNATLRKWAGLFKSADEGALYRSRAHFGLNMTSITAQFERMQVVKSDLLKHSIDTDIVKIYEARLEQEKAQSLWRASTHHELCVEVEAFQRRFKGQHHRQGLGNGNYNQDPTPPERRKAVSAIVSQLHGEAHHQHAVGLSLQSAWTTWPDNVQPFDLSWKNLIWKGQAFTLIKFVLNSTINTNITPVLRKLFNYWTHDKCSNCGQEKCTLHHIISGCQTALQQGRYTWRHDSVLNTMLPHLQAFIDKCNEKRVHRVIPPITKSFVREGETSTFKPNPRQRLGILHQAADWQIQVDFDNQAVFPPTICPCQQRPDVVIWSEVEKIVILGELTCPAEEGVVAAYTRKEKRYRDLLNHINDETAWTAHLFPFEVCARGCVAFSFRKFLNKLGLPNQTVNQACHDVSTVVAKCSYFIYLSVDVKAWNKSRTLLSTDISDQ
jgi:hypothetical protein